MRAAVLRQPGTVELCEVDLAPSPNQVTVAVAATGICGTDLHAFAGRHRFLTYPRVLGHEIAGTVAAVGGAVIDFAAGDRVVVNPFVCCGTCRTCRRGFPNLCPKLEVTGVHVDGGFAEYVQVAPEQLYRLPSDLDLETAALVEPLSIGAEAVACGDVAAGDRVVIIGAGPIGLACLTFAVRRGAEAIVVDRVSSRLEQARGLGAAAVVDASEHDPSDIVKERTDGLGADVVVEAVGTKATIEGALGLVAPGGAYVLLGLYDGTVEIAPASWIRLGIRAVASRLNRGRFPEAIAHLRAHPELARLITHRIGLADLPETMGRLVRREIDAGKVVVVPNGS